MTVIYEYKQLFPSVVKWLDVIRRSQPDNLKSMKLKSGSVRTAGRPSILLPSQDRQMSSAAADSRRLVGSQLGSETVTLSDSSTSRSS